MTFTVERDLVAALTRRIYPNLLFDPGYTEMLREAGIRATPGEPNPLDGAATARLREVATLRMRLFANQLDTALALEPGSIRFCMLQSVSIFRAANAGRPASLAGTWWFDQDVWNACLAAGASDRARIDWLHHHLAVCYDWNTCDRIVRIDIRSPHEVPALRGIGAPKTRLDSPGMYGRVPPGIAHQRTILGGLPGGLVQTVLPFVPNRHIRSELWLRGN